MRRILAAFILALGTLGLLAGPAAATTSVPHGITWQFDSNGQKVAKMVLRVGWTYDGVHVTSIDSIQRETTVLPTAKAAGWTLTGVTKQSGHWVNTDHTEYVANYAIAYHSCPKGSGAPCTDNTFQEKVSVYGDGSFIAKGAPLDCWYHAFVIC